jgi:hypothetical protein
MKRVLIGVVVVVVCVYGGSWLAVAGMKQRYVSRTWPGNLGTLAGVAQRYPDIETNAAATALTKLTGELGISTVPEVKQASPDYDAIKEPLNTYYRAELERIGDQPQPAPANIAAYLARHDAQLNAVRDHVVTAGPIRWVQHFRLGHDAPIPNLLGQMTLTKLFTARALTKAANHDATAWDDLHTVWLLDRELWNRPELISQLIALAGTRMVNASAAKMPLPVPPWFREVQSFDYDHNFTASYQAEAWMIGNAPRRAAQRPFFDACALDAVEKMRLWTANLSNAKSCDVSPVQTMNIASWNYLAQVAMPNIAGAWQRFARFRAELEATDKILTLRGGEVPSTATRCSDGTWSASNLGVKFSRDIAVPAPGIKYPLVYNR